METWTLVVKVVAFRRYVNSFRPEMYVIIVLESIETKKVEYIYLFHPTYTICPFSSSKEGLDPSG